MRENQKTQDSTCDLLVFCIFYQKSKMLLWSIRTFWYKGSAENKKKSQVRKKCYIFQKQQPKTQRLIWGEKLRYDAKFLILSRYDIILDI